MAENTGGIPLQRRILIVTICLGIGVLAQFALQWHLGQAGDNPFPPLTNQLEAFPLEINLPGEKRGWVGIKNPNLDKLIAKLPFQTEGVISRFYRPYKGGPTVQLYMVHSLEGEDRNHHPEVCIREVAGAPEQVKARARLALDGNADRQVQRFRFQTGTSEFTTVYYWHYTIFPVLIEEDTVLQKLHQQISRTPPSITVQVSTVASPAQLKVIEKEFLPAVDRLMVEKHLPATAFIGCDRRSIAVERR